MAEMLDDPAKELRDYEMLWRLFHADKNSKEEELDDDDDECIAVRIIKFLFSWNLDWSAPRDEEHSSYRDEGYTRRPYHRHIQEPVTRPRPASGNLGQNGEILEESYYMKSRKTALIPTAPQTKQYTPEPSFLGYRSNGGAPLTVVTTVVMAIAFIAFSAVNDYLGKFKKLLLNSEEDEREEEKTRNVGKRSKKSA